MARKKKAFGRYLLPLEKSSPTDKLARSIPKPKGAIPNFGLPRWKTMPLESKIPMIPGPQGAYSFARRKLGKKLWIGVPSAEFDLSDPCNIEYNFTYEPLHDEHLANFFSRPNNVRHMLKAGFITERLDAKCSPKDYNVYRKFLKKLHDRRVNGELRLKTQLEREKRALDLAEKHARKEIERLREKERRDEASKELEKLRSREEENPRRARDDRSKLRQIALAKREQARRLRERGKARSEHMRQKLAAAALIRRRRIIETLVKWHENELRRKKATKERLMRKQEEKLKAVETRWETRIAFQRKQLDKRELLYRRVLEQRTTFVEEYNKKVETEQKKIQERLQQTKLFMRCYVRRHLPNQRERICCVKRRRKREHKESEHEEIVVGPCPFKPRAVRRHERNLNVEPSETEREKSKSQSRARKQQSKKKKKRKKKAQESTEEKSEPTIDSESSRLEISPPIVRPSSPVKDKCKCVEIKKP